LERWPAAWLERIPEPPPADPDAEPPPVLPIPELALRCDEPIMPALLGRTDGLFCDLLQAGLLPEPPPPSCEDEGRPSLATRELPGAVIPREPLPAESARDLRYVIMLFTPPTT